MTDKEHPPIGQLSESLEDYVEIIYNLIEENKVARVRDIAKAKDVKMSSVVSALKRLDQEKKVSLAGLPTGITPAINIISG